MGRIPALHPGRVAAGRSHELRARLRCRRTRNVGHGTRGGHGETPRTQDADRRPTAGHGCLQPAALTPPTLLGVRMSATPSPRRGSGAPLRRAVASFVVLGLALVAALSFSPRLGLDLAGGTQIVLETQDSDRVKADRESTDRAL